MSKQRSTLSWGLSFILHGLLALVILRTGYHIAFPEGAVDTVSIETFGNKLASPGAPPKQTQPKHQVRAAPAPVFLPDRPAETIHAAEPEQPIETQEESIAEVRPPAPSLNEVPPMEEPPASSEPSQESQPEITASPIPEQSAAAVGSAEAEGTPTPHPEFGTPGTMLDETKLSEAQGNPKPHYPFMARLRRQEGTVVLRAYVNKNGTLDSVGLSKSSGSPLLDKEALMSYTKWKYKPGAPGWVEKPFRFSLVDSEKK